MRSQLSWIEHLPSKQTVTGSNPVGRTKFNTMAKVKVSTYTAKTVRRKGVHAKTKQSKNKNSKNYKKPYASQGR